MFCANVPWQAMINASAAIIFFMFFYILVLKIKLLWRRFHKDRRVSDGSCYNKSQLFFADVFYLFKDFIGDVLYLSVLDESNDASYEDAESYAVINDIQIFVGIG